MVRSRGPGEFEQVVLLALASFADEASGQQVYDALVRATDREVSVAAVYITLARLEDKGWVAMRSEAPAPGRGGKRRKYYRLREGGADVIAEVRRQYDRLWDGAAEHPLFTSERGDR